MNNIRPNRRRERAGLLADPGRIAPTLDQAWRDSFIVELRLLGVPGNEIGDALVTAETHVQESAESAAQAFGDARTYAREIAESSGTPPTGWRLSTLTVLSIVAGLGGMLAAVGSLSAWLDDRHVTVAMGDLAALGLLALVVVALIARAGEVLRFAVEHRWLSMLVPLLFVAASVGLLVGLRQTVVSVPWPLVAGLAVVALVVSTVTAWLESDHVQDEIVAPGQSPSTDALARAASVLPIPILTVLACGATWLMSWVS